jgi:hypothetical protein
MKTAEFGCRVESRGLDKMCSKFLQMNCGEDACDCAAITTLNYRAFCVNHFLLRCYERLEAIDPQARRLHEEPMDRAALRAFIEECAGKALDVSLRCEDLNNLQRGRLLDILLWAGELFLLLRASRKWTAMEFIRLHQLPNFALGKSIRDMALHRLDVNCPSASAGPDAHREQETLTATLR